VDKQAGKAQTPESYALTSSDYQQQGLRILARIIARVHMQRTANERVNQNEFPKDSR
jgi:hypothetical protein